jgi:1-deoxy-D-xylulose-5-phosphate synthase
MILEKINDPSDIKKLNKDELISLAKDIRLGLLNRVSKIGGHFGPNFGIVEFSIAYHYVFNSPVDKIIFDVSHQTYPHKMLTGRWKNYFYEEEFKNITGYTEPNESIHDMFCVGHTSTSISLALGVAKERDLKGEKFNVVALIGDGSLSGGEALTGLNAGYELNSNFIVVVNDNEQSIAETHGGLYKSLSDLRNSGGKSSNNIFKAFGYDYRYLEDGNDIFKLIDALNEIKDIDHPIVLHIHTLKGKGYKFAEDNKEAWHYHIPFDIKTGKLIHEIKEPNYKTLTKDIIVEHIKKDRNVCFITPGVPQNLGFTPEVRKELKDQYVDCGIAEETCVAMASGMARIGGKPIVGTNASFIQRTYDQLSQEAGINNLPITILLTFTSIFGPHDVTHLSIFALPMIVNIPNFCYMAPTSIEEFSLMLNYAIDNDKGPVVVATPHEFNHNKYPLLSDFSDLNKYQVCKKGKDIAIIGLGTFFNLADSLTSYLEEKGFRPTLINPRFATALDKPLLDEISSNYKLIITLEDCVKNGGFGEKIASYLGDKSIKVLNYGIEKKFYDNFKALDILKENGIDNELIYNRIKEII